MPPVPRQHHKEPIYEELCQDTLLSRRRFKSNIDLLHDAQQDELRQQNVVLRRRKSTENEFPMSVRVNFGVDNNDNNGVGVGKVAKRGNDEEEEFLKPISAEKIVDTKNSDDDDDDDYLKPRTSKKSESVAADDDEYLKPTFGRFERIDSRDLSPPHEMPPPIPMQSYTPLKSSNRNLSG